MTVEFAQAASLAVRAPRRCEITEWLIRWLSCLIFLVGISVSSRAAEPWVAVREPLAVAMGRLPGENPLDLAFEMATTAAASRPVTLAVFDNSPRARDQALAFAAGAWWATDTTGRSRLSLSPTLPRGRLRAERMPCNVAGDPTAIALVTAALLPWTMGIPGDATREGTLSYDLASASWIATLDGSGHNRLLDLLSLLQTPRPQAPPLFRELALSPTDTTYAIDLIGGDWRDWCWGLASAMSANVSLDATLADGIPPRLTVTGDIRAVQAALASHAIASHCIAGTWCLGPNAQDAAIANREHPAQRSTLALIPIHHVLQEGVTGEALTATVRAAVAPSAWGLPGWDISWRPTLNALLVIADPLTIHQVLDALDVLDRDGPAAGMAALAPPTPR